MGLLCRSRVSDKKDSECIGAASKSIPKVIGDGTMTIIARTYGIAHGGLSETCAPTALTQRGEEFPSRW